MNTKDGAAERPLTLLERLAQRPSSVEANEPESVSPAVVAALAAAMGRPFPASEPPPATTGPATMPMPAMSAFPPPPADITAPMPMFNPGTALQLVPPVAPPLDDTLPVPISRTRRSEVSEETRAHDRLHAAAVGFVAGMIVVVPAVLLATGQLDGFLGPVWQSSPARPPATRTAEAPVRQAPAATAASAMLAETRPPVEPMTLAAKTIPEPAAATALSLPLAPPTETLRIEARGRIEAGDVAAARDVLSRAVALGDAEATLSLAETFDPNMLAAWNARGIKPEVGTARTLYQKALSLGVSKARQRLDALE